MAFVNGAEAGESQKLNPHTNAVKVTQDEEFINAGTTICI